KIAKNTFAPEWYLVSYIPLTGLEKTLNLLNDYILAIIAVIILISLFLAVYVSKVAIARIEKMKKNMEYFGKGDVDVQFCERETQDELWFLERSFDEMKVQIKKLIEKNNITKEHQRESELQALQAQINPHFVYNTLDSIGWMAKSKNQPEIVKMVEALASFFRISLHKGDKFITVKEEIEHVRSYIAIEEIRIPNKFTVLFDIAENILEQKILKILLQPLIENAINHGAMEKEGTCGIRINAFEMDDVLHFEVIDDGVGFDVDILNDKERMKAKSGGYAIKNVNERIKLEYGEEFGVIYSSVPGKYTRAEITLPIN
ncbi:MAG: sensor histidine kinase, partial [Oscillospiraceae bacterium]